MKVLHIFDHSIPLQSGYTFRSLSILRSQQANGIATCHITSSKQGRFAELVEQIDGLTFYRTKEVSGLLAKIPVVRQIAIIFSLTKRIIEVAKIEHPDMLHAHSPALNGIAALLAKNKLKIPVVYEVRGFWEDAAVDHGTSKEGSLRYRATRAMDTYVVKKADAVTCICEGIKGDLIKRGIDSDKITVVPNGVDASAYVMRQGKSKEIIDRYSLADKKVVGFIGSFYRYEGLDLLVKSMPFILSELPETRLLLLGGGVHGDYVRQLVTDLNLGDKVIMPGRVPHDQVSKFYSVLDLLILPRRSMRLTELVTPLKPLEAMAQGIPVLASDIGGHQELISDNVTGYMFAHSNIDDLAARAVKILRRDENQEIISQARAFVEQEKNWQTTVLRYRDVYENTQVLKMVS